MYLRLFWNSLCRMNTNPQRSTCLYPPSVGIKSMSHYTWLALANSYLSFKFTSIIFSRKLSCMIFTLKPNKKNKLYFLLTTQNIRSDGLGRVFCENTSIYFSHRHIYIYRTWFYGFGGRYINCFSYILFIKK